MEKGTLFLVSVPIGNEKDITLRAIEVLNNVDAIACEDTRKAGLLLQSLSRLVPWFTNNPLKISYFEHNEQTKIPGILNLLLNGKNVALISDAGTPTISDPGYRITTACIQHNIPLVSVPGPSSPLAALSVAGLPTDKFLFLGYPPKKEGKRKKLFEETKQLLETSIQLHPTVILFESPHRLQKTLIELQEIFGEREIVVVRELTKTHEEIRRESIQEAITHFNKFLPKGEFMILFQ